MAAHSKTPELAEMTPEVDSSEGVPEGHSGTIGDDLTTDNHGSNHPLEKSRRIGSLEGVDTDSRRHSKTQTRWTGTSISLSNPFFPREAF